MTNTAADRLKELAGSYHFTAHESDDTDYDLRPTKHANAADVIQLLHFLNKEEGYNVFPLRDNSLHVHAPHRKEHAWDDRGWDCPAGLSVKGCEALREGR